MNYFIKLPLPTQFWLIQNQEKITMITCWLAMLYGMFLEWWNHKVDITEGASAQFSTLWAAQGSKGKNQYELLPTFGGDLFMLSWAKKKKIKNVISGVLLRSPFTTTINEMSINHVKCLSENCCFSLLFLLSNLKYI